MKRARRLTVLAASAGLVMLGLMAGGATSASTSAKAAPPNDSIDSATRLGTPPASFVEDTSHATADATDGSCVEGASVWFRTRPAVTRRVRLSTLGSSYDTLLAVFEGPKADRKRIACVDDSFETDQAAFASARQVRLVAGTTYWIAVSACCSPTARGGQLVLTTWPPTSPGITAVVDSVETGTVSGQLLVSGTVTCLTPSEFEVDVTARQRVAGGANVAQGEGYVDGVCDTASTSPSTTWSIAVDSQTGWAFQTGTVRLTRNAFVSDGIRGGQVGPDTDNFVVTANPDARSPHPVR